MIIAHFVYHLDNYSGAAFQALLLAEHLPEHEYIFFNLCNAPTVREHAKNDRITVIDLPSNKIVQFLEVIKRIRGRQIAIFHLHGFILLGLITGLLLRKKIVLKTTLMRYDDLATIAASRWGAIKLFLVKRIATNVVLSAPLRRTNERFLPAAKVIKIPNGIRLPAPHSFNEKKDPVFCSVGVISERKGTLEVIRYFLDHYAALPGSHLYLVGPDSSLDGIPELNEAYVGSCKHTVASSHHATAITFTGKLTKKEVEKTYEQSIAHLFFSKSEGLPNVILESMAFNCVPVMLPLDGTAAEIVTNGIDGFIIDDPSVAIPFQDIRTIIGSGATMRKAATFTIESTAAAYRELYDELMK